MTSMPDAGPTVGTTTIGVSDGAIDPVPRPDRNRHVRRTDRHRREHARDLHLRRRRELRRPGRRAATTASSTTTSSSPARPATPTVTSTTTASSTPATTASSTTRSSLQGAPIPMTGGVAEASAGCRRDRGAGAGVAVGDCFGLRVCSAAVAVAARNDERSQLFFGSFRCRRHRHRSSQFDRGSRALAVAAYVCDRILQDRARRRRPQRWWR